jgi:hypothetical protein
MAVLFVGGAVFFYIRDGFGATVIVLLMFAALMVAVQILRNRPWPEPEGNERDTCRGCHIPVSRENGKICPICGASWCNTCMERDGIILSDDKGCPSCYEDK